jgi:hypothetical protein
MAEVLPNKISRTPKIGCTEVASYSKHWPCLFPQHGPGRKHAGSSMSPGSRNWSTSTHAPWSVGCSTPMGAGC